MKLILLLLFLIIVLVLLEYTKSEKREHFKNQKYLKNLVLSNIFGDKDSLSKEELKEKINNYYNLFLLFHGKDTITRKDIEDYLSK